MDRRGVIEQAIGEALTCRGTVMLQVEGDDARWIAAVAAVDGALELRTGEPSRTWRVWRAAPGERWLEAHGFHQVIDAWSHPVSGAPEARRDARLLDDALTMALGAEPGAGLERVLVQPGIVPRLVAPAPPGASREEHLRATLAVLVRAREGRVSFGGGRPERLWGVAYVRGDRLMVEPEPVSIRTKPEVWDVPLEPGAEIGAARRLVAELAAIGRAADGDPLFVALLDI